MRKDNDLDPVFESDRNGGSTPPENGEESSGIVGRPADVADHTVGFHERSETPALERERFDNEEALDDGGSFDGLGVPVAEDGPPSRG